MTRLSNWHAATLLALAMTPLAAATPLHVDDDAPPGGDGLTWATAFRCLQDALGAASPGMEVLVGAGVYRPDASEHGMASPGDRSATFGLVDGVAILGGHRGLGGGGSPDDRDPSVFVTILSGDLSGSDEANWVNFSENSTHVVTASNVGGGALIDGFTVRGGYATSSSGLDGSGAALRIMGGSPTISNCVISTSLAHLGGGALVFGGAPRFLGCRFEGDWAYVGRGGALYGPSGTTIDARDCEFFDNYSYGPGSVGDGGAVFLESGSEATFVRCDFWLNESSGSQPAYANGGAICALADVLRLVSCRFGRNSALVGGAVWAAGETLIVNCEFNGNSALVGGAISAFTADLTIADSTFVGNHAGDGGALDNNLQSVTTIANSVFWGNTSNAPTGLKQAIHNADSATTSVRWTCVEGLFDQEPGEDPIDPANYPGCIESDPLLLDANGADNVLGSADDDTRLAAGSPAVDAGRNSLIPADGADVDGDGNTGEATPLDLAGGARRFDDPSAPDVGAGAAPIVDMGAYERGAPVECLGDIDGDGFIGFGDLNALLGMFNATGSGLAADIDDDGDVDFADLNTLLGLYNSAC